MPGLIGFHLRSFLVAVEAGIPVVPIVISGSRSALRGGQWLPRPSQISVHIGKAVRADGSDFSAAVRLAMWCARACSRFAKSRISRCRRYRGEAIARLSGSCTRMKSPRLGNTRWYARAPGETLSFEENDVSARFQRHGPVRTEHSQYRQTRDRLFDQLQYRLRVTV